MEAASDTLSRARNRWQKVTGPATALIMTCLRLGWRAQGPRLFTHTDRVLDMRVDPPAVVKQHMQEAVMGGRRF